MIVVSNTSPIINLAAIGRLELLQQLYGTIAIPQAVYHEIAIRGVSVIGIAIKQKRASKKLSLLASTFSVSSYFPVLPSTGAIISMGQGKHSS